MVALVNVSFETMQTSSTRMERETDPIEHFEHSGHQTKLLKPTMLIARRSLDSRRGKASVTIVDALIEHQRIAAI